MGSLSDPKYFGPGAWFVIHVMALDATTLAKKRSFYNMMEAVVPKIQCTKCRGHAIEYLEKYPPKKTMFSTHEGQDVSMFRWSWVFHNRVNVRLGKPIIPFEQAYNIYMNPGEVCNDCGKEDESGNSPGRVNIPSNKYAPDSDWPSQLVTVYKGGFAHS